jgi:hypothetical protein
MMTETEKWNVGKIEDIKYLFDFSRYHPEKDGAAETMWFSVKLVVEQS